MAFNIFIYILAGLGAGVGTGLAGLSAAAVISPMLITFLGFPAYEAVGISLASDVLASAVSAYTYDTAAPAELGALPTADEVAAALDTPVQVHGQQLSLAEHIERLEQNRSAAPRIA